MFDVTDEHKEKRGKKEFCLFSLISLLIFHDVLSLEEIVYAGGGFMVSPRAKYTGINKLSNNWMFHEDENPLYSFF